MKEKSSFVLYHDIRTPLELLGDADRGKLFLAILNYSERNEMPDFDGSLQMAFAFIKTDLDRDTAAWEAKREERAEAGRRGGKATQAKLKSALANEANQAAPVPVPVPAPVNKRDLGADKPPKHIRFVPPSLSEIRDYCQERRNNVDPEKFFDFYESKGWLVGKNKMKDWRAAVRNWERGENHGAISSSTVDHGQAEGRWGKLQSVQLD